MHDLVKELLELKMLLIYADDDGDYTYYRRLINSTLKRMGEVEVGRKMSMSKSCTSKGLKPPEAILNEMENSESEAHRKLFKKWRE